MQGDGNLGDPQAFERRFDDQLGREFHAGRAEVHAPIAIRGESPQAAMEIVRRTFEQKPADEGQCRIADPAMLPRHRSGHHGPSSGRQAAAHHQLVTLPKLFHERLHVGKIVAVIRIPHQDPFAGGGLDSSAQGIAITLLSHRDDSRALFDGDLLRAVRAAVVGDDDFSFYSRVLESLAGFTNAGCERFRLVQARHDDRKLGSWKIGIHRSWGGIQVNRF